MYRGSLIWVYAYRQQNALSASDVSKQCEYCFKTVEILISLRFSHLSSVNFTFEERDLCVSVVAQTRTNIGVGPFLSFRVSESIR